MKVQTATLSRFKALDDEAGGEPEGTFEAVVSIFGNVDYAGDRVVKGAFAKSLETWKASGDPIPVVWSHQWQDPEMHIGGVLEAEERDEGLWVKAQLDVADDAVAAKVWRLLSQRRVREFSFAYDVLEEKQRKDANDLLELDVIEVGPTLKGMNPDTLLLEAKSRRDARAARRATDSGRRHGAKSAVATHETDTSTGEWDGPANEARLNDDAGEDTYRAAFAWQDPDGDADTKAAWKFIHHEIGEDGTVGAANLQACRTGIGVLNGARSGTSIPEGDVQGVYDHLAAHIRDADEEPPELGGADDQSAASDAASDEAVHTPPQAVQDNAQRALDAIEAGEAGEGFTDTGRARAAQLARGDDVSLDVCREMVAYFARHDGDEGRDEPHTPAWVAWNAWGGDEGWTWAQGIVDDADEDEDDSDEAEDGSGSSGSSSRRAGRKARVTLDGSVEQLQERLSAAVVDWALAAFRDVFVAGLEATWPEQGRVVTYIETWAQPWGGGDYHEASFEIDDDGAVSLGEPAEVELVGVVAPKSLPAAAQAKKNDVAAVPAGPTTGASPTSLLATLAAVELDDA